MNIYLFHVVEIYNVYNLIYSPINIQFWLDLHEQMKHNADKWYETHPPFASINFE